MTKDIDENKEIRDGLLSQFLSSHILKKPTGKTDIIQYDGNIKHMSYCFNDSLACEWYKAHNKTLLNETIYLQMFGEKKKFDMQQRSSDMDVTTEEKVTEEFKDLLHMYLKNGVISDQRYKIFASILGLYDVCIYDNKYICYVQKQDVDMISFQNTVSVEVGGQTYSTDLSEEIEITQYEQALLLIKEVDDGYYDVRTHSMCDTVDKKLTQTSYQIGQDVTIHIKQGELISVNMKPTEYRSVKEDGVYQIYSPDGTKTAASKFKPVQYINNEDGSTYILLVGAYTHLLRKSLEFTPLTWQYKFLMNMLRLNYVAGTRRSGKTKLSAYLIVRELWRMPSTPQQSQRPIKVLYVAPTEDKLEEVMDYIKTSTEKIRLLKVMRVLDGKKKRVILSDEVASRNGKSYNDVGVCMFGSSKGFEPGRGKASDFIMIDEAGFIHEDIYLNILPILENERARLYCISTIDWNTPRQWFYENLVEAERGLDKESYSLRVTIDDIDDWLIPAESKKRMKNALKNNTQRYYAELYATFPSMDSVFSTEGFFIASERSESPMMAIIGYDPAKRHDISAVVIGHIYKDRCELVREHSLSGEYSVGQKDKLMQLKQSYINNGIPVVNIMDGTGVGTGVAEILGSLIDYKVWYTGQLKKPEIDRFGFWKVSKEILVSTTRILMESGRLKCFLGLENLMTQMKSFKKLETGSGAFKYEADSGYDDHVNAMMLVAFCYGVIQGNIYDIYKDITSDYINGIQDREGGLYKSTSFRGFGAATPTGTTFGFGI